MRAKHFLCFKQQQNLERRFGNSKAYLRPQVAKAGPFKAVVLLSLMHYLLLLQLFMGALSLILPVLLFHTLCPSMFAIILMGKRELVALL